MTKYSTKTLIKAMSLKLEKIEGIYYTNPKSDKDIYKHKITIDENNKIECGCKWSQINLKKPNKVLCSHALSVLYRTNRDDFWREVSK